MYYKDDPPNPTNKIDVISPTERIPDDSRLSASRIAGNDTPVDPLLQRLVFASDLDQPQTQSISAKLPTLLFRSTKSRTQGGRTNHLRQILQKQTPGL